jgi:hypothetical protein
MLIKTSCFDLHQRALCQKILTTTEILRSTKEECMALEMEADSHCWLNNK